MKSILQAEKYRYEYTESDVDTPILWESHCHAQFEMLAVLEGDVSIMLEGRSYRLTKHQTVVLPPLLYHTVTANKKGEYRRIAVLFDVGAIPPMLRDRFLKRDTRLTIFFFDRLEELKRICCDEHPQFYEPLAESLMIQLLYGAAQAEQTDTDIEADSFLQRIISYIEEHLCEKIRLDDLARHTSRSKSSVCHLFEEKMNVSPKQYILQKKLAFAAKLIRDGTPPTLAAMQVGYENYSNFYRMYRKHFGIVPTRAREA